MSDDVMYPKMIRHRGYLVWARRQYPGDVWVRRFPPEGEPFGWRAVVAYRHDVIEFTECYHDRQEAMCAGIAIADQMPEMPLPTA